MSTFRVPFISAILLWMSLYAPSSAVAQTDKVDPVKSPAVVHFTKPHNIAPFEQLFIALYNVDDEKDPLGYFTLPREQQLNQAPVLTLKGAEGLYDDKRQAKLRQLAIEAIQKRKLQLSTPLPGAPGAPEPAPESILIVELLLSTEPDAVTNISKKVARYRCQIFSYSEKNPESSPIFTTSKGEVLPKAACAGNFDAACLRDVVKAALESAKRKIEREKLSLAGSKSELTVGSKTETPDHKADPTAPKAESSGKDAVSSAPKKDELPPVKPIIAPQLRLSLGTPLEPLYRDSWSNSRSRPMRWSLGLLLAGTAASTAVTLTLGLLNWHSDVSTLQLPSTCGPGANMSCGVVEHDLKSGFWISLAATLGLAAGSTAALYIDYDHWRDRVCQANPADCHSATK